VDVNVVHFKNCLYLFCNIVDGLPLTTVGKYENYDVFNEPNPVTQSPYRASTVRLMVGLILNIIIIEQGL